MVVSGSVDELPQRAAKEDVVRIVTAIVAALSLIAATSYAEARSHKKHYRSYKPKPAFTRIYGRPGGHRMGYEADPFLYRNGPYGQTPYFDSRNFWERVQSGPGDETTSPSAF
jgi:hypothetical protein